MIRISALSLCALITAVAAEARTRAAGLAPHNSRDRGAFAFHYAPALSDEALVWYSRFELLVTHEPLPRHQVDRLRAAGTKLVLYEWAVAFYDSRATDWQRSLIKRGGTELLNSRPLTGGSGADDAGAWYFDPANPEHEAGRVEDLVRRLNEFGYDGIFFDTTTEESVHPLARAEFARRHPRYPYDLAFSRFLQRLRQRLPNGIIFTNQGYRKAEYYLPYVDWDLTEGLVMHLQQGSYRANAWEDPIDPWKSIHFVMREMIEPLTARYPRVRFAHLNYTEKGNPEAIKLVLATAKIFSGEGFVAAPTIADEVHSAYFIDVGRPLSQHIDSPDGRTSYRFFEKGLVAVTQSYYPVRIINWYRKNLRDRASGHTYCGTDIILAASPSHPKAHLFEEISDCR